MEEKVGGLDKYFVSLGLSRGVLKWASTGERG